MWVQMLEGISGGRPGGDAWPPKYAVFEVDDDEGIALVRGQLARQVAAPDWARPAPPPSAPPAAQSWETPVSVTEVTQTPAAVKAAEAAPPVPHHEPPPPAPSPEVPRPAPADPKSAWVAYAVSQGTSLDEAGALTKAQLQSAFGGRL